MAVQLTVERGSIRRALSTPSPAPASGRANSRRGRAELLERLTPRERERLPLLHGDASTRRIVRALDLSLRTVEAHRACILDKLETPTRQALAIRFGDRDARRA